MRHIIWILFSVIIFTSCASGTTENNQPVQQDQPAAEVRDGVFIHISSGYDNPHRVLMPLKMATMMAENKDVLIYMDIDAVNLLIKEAENLEMEGFDNFQSYIDQLREMNITIMACPTCLEIAGFQPEDLKEGIIIAEKERFFNFTEGRIITLDY